MDNIANIDDKHTAIEMLQIEPLMTMASPLITFAQWSAFVYFCLQLTFMVCFTVYNIPDMCCLADHFKLNISQCSATSNSTMINNCKSNTFQAISSSGWFFIWPAIVLFLMTRDILIWSTTKGKNLLCGCHNKVTPKDSPHTSKISLKDDTKPNRSSSTNGVRIFPTPIHFFLSFSHTLSKARNIFPRIDSVVQFSFVAFVLAWVILYSVGTNYELYLRITGAVFITGWLYTSMQPLDSRYNSVCLKSWFGEWCCFLRHREVHLHLCLCSRRIFLCQSESQGSHSNQTLTDTVYMTFGLMLTLGNLFDDTMDATYESDEGDMNILRVVVALYLCIVTIVLLNLLIALMNHTFDERKNASILFKLSLLKRAMNTILLNKNLQQKPEPPIKPLSLFGSFSTKLCCVQQMFMCFLCCFNWKKSNSAEESNDIGNNGIKSNKKSKNTDGLENYDEINVLFEIPEDVANIIKSSDIFRHREVDHNLMNRDFQNANLASATVEKVAVTDSSETKSNLLPEINLCRDVKEKKIKRGDAEHKAKEKERRRRERERKKRKEKETDAKIEFLSNTCSAILEKIDTVGENREFVSCELYSTNYTQRSIWSEWRRYGHTFPW